MPHHILDRKYLNLLLSSMPGVVWEASGHPDHKEQSINYVSDGVEHMLGYTAEEWLSTPNFWLTLVHPDDREQAAIASRRFYDSKAAGVNRFRWIRKDGRVIWVEAHSTVVTDEAGTPIGMRGVTLDITERVEAEQAVHESRERLDGIVNSAMDAIVTIDEAQKIVVFNRAAETMFAMTAQDALGLPLETLIPQELRELHRDHVKDFSTTGVTSRSMSSPGLLQGRRSDGSIFPLEATISKVETSGGKLFTAIIRDITERVKRQEQLQYLREAGRVLASSLDYETTITNLAELTVPFFADWFAVDLVTPDGKGLDLIAVSHVDPSKIELAHELRRRYPTDLTAPAAADHPILTGELQYYPAIDDELLKAAVPDPELLEIMRSLGLRSSIVIPLRTRERVFGVITFIMGKSGRSYTEQDVETAKELATRAAFAIDNARLYRDAQQAIQHRDDLFSIVSHDLRNPLSAIEISATLLRRKVGETINTKPLDRIDKAAKRALALIEDLNLVAKIDTGAGFTLTTEKLAIREVLSELEDMFQPLAIDKKIELKVAPAAGSDALVNVDPKRLYQALSNFVANALKFSPAHSTVTIGAQIANGTAILSVEDQGSGIPAANFADVFKKNWQGNKEKHQGSGLGLYIAKAIIDAHGGKVEIESEINRGTTFRIVLPTVG